MNTAETKKLSQEQIKAFEKAYQETVDNQIKLAFGTSPKFKGTFSMANPSAEKRMFNSWIRINCV